MPREGLRNVADWARRSDENVVEEEAAGAVGGGGLGCVSVRVRVDCVGMGWR